MTIAFHRKIYNLLIMNLIARLHMRHVRYFLEVARVESVSQAAMRLNISQPAVSRTLKELETILGVALFERVGRGLQLNDSGRIFQTHASISIIELMRGYERLKNSAKHSARLSVGVLPTVAASLVPRAALAFHELVPHCKLRISTGPVRLCFDQLRNGALDLVVGRMPEEEMSSGISFEQLYIEDVLLVCQPAHELLTINQPERKISNYPLVLPPEDAAIYATVQRFLTSIGLPEMPGAFETVDLPIGRKIVRSSNALWFISRGVVLDELESNILAPVILKSPLLEGPIGISISRSAPLSAERSFFEDCLRQAVDVS